MIRAGELSQARQLGRPKPSPRDLNTRQYRYAFSQLSTNVVALANYVLIDQPGFVFGLNPATDPNGVVIVHVNEPGTPFYMTPGCVKRVPAGFDRLYLERPTQPAVPARTDLFYVIDVSDKVNELEYGPLTGASQNAGADNYVAPGKITVGAVVGAGVPGTTILAAQPGRRRFRIRNVSLANEVVWLAFASTANLDTDQGVFAELSVGEIAELDFTGAIYAFAQANTAIVLPLAIS